MPDRIITDEANAYAAARGVIIGVYTLEELQAAFAGKPVNLLPWAFAFPPTTVIVYNADNTVASVTENGITTAYTYNVDGSVATDTRNFVTRAYVYDGLGNLTSVTGI